MTEKKELYEHYKNKSLEELEQERFYNRMIDHWEHLNYLIEDVLNELIKEKEKNNC